MVFLRLKNRLGGSTFFTAMFQIHWYCVEALRDDKIMRRHFLSRFLYAFQIAVLLRLKISFC